MIDYKNGNTLFKIYKRLKELRFVSYTDSHGVVMVRWLGEWRPYDYVMQYDKRLVIQE